MNTKETTRLMKFTDTRNRILLLFIVVSISGIPCGAFSSNSQGADSTDEKVLVHLNKPVYIAGEMLRYRVYTFNNQTLEPYLNSRVLYFALTDYNGITTLQWRINVHRGDNSGYCRLPADLKGGVYTLTAYTSQMRNDRYESLFKQNIVISSLSNEFPDTLYIPVINSNRAFSTVFEEAIQDLVVKVGNVYNAGDTAETIITLNKELTGDTASLSISVFLSVPLTNITINDSLLQMKRITPIHTGSGNGSSDQVYAKEDKSYMLSGTVRSKLTNSPIAGGKILLAVNDSLFPHIRYSRTDSTGRFIFYLDRWFDNRDLILQNGDAAVEGGILWEIDRKRLPVPGRPYVPYAVHHSEINSITMLNESRLIESVYLDPVNTASAAELPPGTNYFGPPDMLVKPADFSDLVNLKEITENILPGVRFIGRNNTYAIQVFNLKTGQWPETNMILLNGVPFYDMNYIATLGTKNISRIEVISGNYLLGYLTLEGLVSIYTFDHKIPEAYLKNRSFIFQNTVVPSGNPASRVVSGKASVSSSHDPDFRVNLLWEPAREITGNQQLVLRFPTSLLKGFYDIVVNGLSRKGTILSGSTSFEVK